jgi:FAD/FMN-containing dehydrogenase
MRSKKQVLTNFSGSLTSDSFCLRPDTEKELTHYMAQNKPQALLTRGSGLSYNDCGFNKNGLVIDTRHLNHFISFDPSSGIALCQAGVTFHDLLYLNQNYIPPVLPGTLHATLAGGLANDIHGKNNPHAQSLGHHVEWFELLLNKELVHCSRKENSDLFYATIAGLGLTGVITRIAIRLKKASPYVQVENESYSSLKSLLERMASHGLSYEYQVAWLDLLHSTPRALLSLANHCDPFPITQKSTYSVPKLPFNLIKKWNMKWLNKYYFHHKKNHESLSLEEFNNPLDKINHWNYLYGKKGLLQFQAVFAEDIAHSTLVQLIKIINKYNAVPTLAVLKLFKHPGEGLLSFCTPGFTLAVDFNNNQAAQRAIKEMNQYITEIKGTIYLAKDLFLTQEQYQIMYEKHAKFSQIIKEHRVPMRSDLAERLGITK